MPTRHMCALEQESWSSELLKAAFTGSCSVYPSSYEASLYTGTLQLCTVLALHAARDALVATWLYSYIPPRCLPTRLKSVMQLSLIHI